VAPYAGIVKRSNTGDCKSSGKPLKFMLIGFPAIFICMAGVFTVVAGITGGFGAHTLIKHIEVSGLGVAISVIGFYLLYTGSDRDFEYMFDMVIGTIFRI
jgi:hypothetical protein